MRKTVSIIGCGNIGLPLAKLLIKDGFFVKGSTTRNSRLPMLKKAGIQAFLINLNHDDSNRLLSDLIHADIVVITFPPSSTQKSSKSYEKQLQLISQKLQASGIQKLIFTSSTDVYPQKNDWVNEQDAAIIKPRFTQIPVLTLEQTFTEQKSFKTTILRFAGLMGPDYRSSFHLAGRDLKGADDLINMVHQEDCVAVMHKIIKNGIWGETYNVVADLHPTKREYYNQLCDLQGLARPIYIKGESNYRIVSNDKLKQALNYQFIYPDPLAI